MKTKKAELVWARAVLEVFENLGTPVVDQKWTSLSAKHLHTWFRESEKNETAFMKDMAPKASLILEKYGSADIDDEVVKMDTKTIKDLQSLLQTALAASEDGVYKEEVSEPPKPQEEPLGPYAELVLKSIEEKTVAHFTAKEEAPQETAPGGLSEEEPSLEDLF